MFELMLAAKTVEEVLKGVPPTVTKRQQLVLIPHCCSIWITGPNWLNAAPVPHTAATATAAAAATAAAVPISTAAAAAAAAAAATTATAAIRGCEYTIR